MTPLARILLFLGLGWLTLVLFREARVAAHQPDFDGSKLVLLFASVVLVGGITGVLFVIMVMPSIGDAVGNFFFQPNQRATRDPHARAQAARARGDYAEAVEEYHKAIDRDPNDTLAYSEIARILCEHLEDPAGAVEMLERALEAEWSPDDAAFLSNRLVDVYWDYQHDAQNARDMLLQIVAAMPDTRHSANAQHRLQTIAEQPPLEE